MASTRSQTSEPLTAKTFCRPPPLEVSTNLNMWRARIEISLRNIHPDDQVQRVVECLSNDVFELLWAAGLPNDITLPQLWSKLAQVIPADVEAIEARRTFPDRVQLPNEPVQRYAQELQRLVARGLANQPEEQRQAALLQRFQAGIRDPDARRLFLRQPVTNFDEAVATARACETANRLIPSTSHEECFAVGNAPQRWGRGRWTNPGRSQARGCRYCQPHGWNGHSWGHNRPPNRRGMYQGGRNPNRGYTPGQVYMLKVKVQRYVAGKKPDFASSSSSSDSDAEQSSQQQVEEIKAFSSRPSIVKGRQARQHRGDAGDGEDRSDEESEQRLTTAELEDPRFQRLLKAKEQLSESSEEDEDVEDRIARHKKHRRSGNFSEESPQHSGEEEVDEEELDEAELVKKRELIRRKALAARQKDEAEKGDDVWAPEEAEEADDEEDLEYSEEEYTSSEDEVAPKLKPVFVRACDRVTLQAKQKAEQLDEEKELESTRLADERRKTTLKLLESELRREVEEAHAIEDALDALDSDEGQGNPQAEQEEYEKWKVRELRRIRRDREAREAITLDKNEIERIRQMTDDQRREEFLRNPKSVTNQAPKGRYKFLQKYYHRGAFYVSSLDDNVFQQDFAQPTLEDHFDKTKLPDVMQVKNFGRAGRTKYTHLVDQDTTAFDSPWSTGNQQNVKFQSTHGGGFKQLFKKPSLAGSKKTK